MSTASYLLEYGYHSWLVLIQKFGEATRFTRIGAVPSVGSGAVKHCASPRQFCQSEACQSSSPGVSWGTQSSKPLCERPARHPAVADCSAVSSLQLTGCLALRASALSPGLAYLPAVPLHSAHRCHFHPLYPVQSLSRVALRVAPHNRGHACSIGDGAWYESEETPC